MDTVVKSPPGCITGILRYKEEEMEPRARFELAIS